MKKTLITLMAMASCATAAEYSFADLENHPDSYNAVTVCLTLNVEGLQAISESNFTGLTETKPNVFMLTGTWGDNAEGSIGLVHNGSSTGSKNCSFYSSWTKGSGSGNNTATNLPTIFNNSTAWDSITDVATVYSFDTTDSSVAKGIVNTGISVRYNDGTISTFGGHTENIVFSGVYNFNATGITLNDSLVDSWYIQSGATTQAGAEYYSSIMIPEPATATLSLLALAGLAALRRRK